jgi:hypothetical protein
MMQSLILVAALAIHHSVALQVPFVSKIVVDYYSPLIGGGSMLDNAGE